MKTTLALITLIVISTAVQSQNSVYIEATEFGRGILKSRSGECFVITPDHVVNDVAGKDILIYGEKSIKSKGEYVSSYPSDLAIVRIDAGGKQNCEEWEVHKNYGSILKKVYEGFIETRTKEGNTQPMPVSIAYIDDTYIHVKPRNFRDQFVQGLSGTSLFSNIDGEKVYLGMLQSIDEEDNGLGYVIRVDVMDRILAGFFHVESQSNNKAGNAFRSEHNYTSSDFSTEILGMQIDLVEYKKNGATVTFTFNVTSLERDLVFSTNTAGISIFDDKGLYTKASNITIGNKSSYQVYYTLVQGVKTPLEITFENVRSSAAGISLFKAQISNQLNKREFEIRNLSLGSIQKKSPPLEKSLWSEELLGFHVDLIDYQKSGGNVVLKFQITSKDRDQVLFMTTGNIFFFDEKGFGYKATTITAGNQSSYQIYYEMVQGVSVPVEITFSNVSSSAKGISLFKTELSCNNSKREIQIRNLTFDNKNLTLTYPYQKGIWSKNLLGYDIQLLRYQKSGNSAIVSLGVTSRDQDKVLFMNTNGSTMYDERGMITKASNIMVANQSSYQIYHYMVEDVQVPVEITFDNISSSATGISLFKTQLKSDNKTEEFQVRDLSFSGEQKKLDSKCSSVYFYRTNGIGQSDKPVYLVKGSNVVATLDLGSRYRTFICEDNKCSLEVKLDLNTLSLNKIELSPIPNQNFYYKISCTPGFEFATVKKMESNKAEQELNNDKKFLKNLEPLTIK